jgi:hypothetical protein
MIDIEFLIIFIIVGILYCAYVLEYIYLKRLQIELEVIRAVLKDYNLTIANNILHIETLKVEVSLIKEYLNEGKEENEKL